MDSGVKWRYITKEFGNWNSIYHKFRKWKVYLNQSCKR
ncbi:MAG: hypothetical protein IJS29_06350 [Selenomonadaceae bacterium]|nr:hypothetical protein [Selenomonadaceae bacterium]